MAYSDYGAFVYLDVIAENPHRFIEQYEVYCEEVIRLGGKL